MVVWTVVLCIACVVSGHVISQLDYTNEIQEDTDELKVIRDVIKVDFGGDVDERHGAPRADSKDMLYPILIGVAAKIVSTIPLFLTSLALVAGYSLATSKAALLLGGIAVVYHYISVYHPSVSHLSSPSGWLQFGYQ
ncbi:uncharacterized protein LOC128994677 [Macrosteles quadrilineatus]|uniref:uncharacterized protein LOC128994677 n=1 Tax=Macrosteles quadrilineatus TaxID=74068 RepID=UPI0023E2802B|nr:uncharacterized protein LOC128994677 [Macrosteles quadrilineatus]